MTDTAAAETAPPAVAAARTNAPNKKKAVPRPTGPPLGEQILKIVADCKDRKGISLAAIKKVLAAKGLDVEKHRSQIKLSIKRNVEKGSLKPANKKTAVKKLTAKKPAAKKSAVKKSITKKAAKSPIKKKAAAKKPKTPKPVKAKKVEKARAKPKPKSAKPKKAAGKKK
ncbi:histone H1-like [Heptranchias perlo]|uniref:histone H1-like n=1 Tax=Heptranchias perlo TaxID=212740 RepID=UPI003559A6EC